MLKYAWTYAINQRTRVVPTATIIMKIVMTGSAKGLYWFLTRIVIPSTR